MREDISYGVIPITDDQQVLLLQNVNGMWGFPIGHREGNESPLETALRELKEETAISDISIDENNIYKEETTNKNKKRIIYFYVGHVKNRDVVIDLNENIDYKWIPFDQVESKISYRSTVVLFKNIFGLC